MVRGKSAAIALAVLCVGLGCWWNDNPRGSRSSSLGPALLDTQFQWDAKTKRDVPRYHVLFVPRWHVAQDAGFGLSGGRSGTRERRSHQYTFHENGRSAPVVHSQPLHVLRTNTVEASGRTFELVTGGIFVAEVNRDGTLAVTPLPATPPDATPEQILAYVKKSMPGNVWVQAVKPR